jgi:tetratricopeptide (TPR) repeat protein
MTRIGRAWADWTRRHQYGLGKLLEKRGRYQDALVAFKASEDYYTEKYGSLHTFVGAALMKQGFCNGMLGRRDAACMAYRRALEVGIANYGVEHSMWSDIKSYLESECQHQ